MRCETGVEGKLERNCAWEFGRVLGLGPGVQAKRGGEGQAFRFALWANAAAGLGSWEDANCEGEGETGLLGKGEGEKESEPVPAHRRFFSSARVSAAEALARASPNQGQSRS